MNRKIAPELTPINQVNLIFPTKVDLGNGIDLHWMNNIPDNTVKLDIIWDAGSKYQNKPLIASFCNQLLLSGNDSTSANQIAGEIDSLGGYISHNQHKDHAGLTIFGLTDSIESIFNIIQSNLMHGSFPKTEIAKWREIKRKEFELNEEKVSTNARKLFTKNIFGAQHPYGKLAVIKDFDRVSQADLKQFFIQKYSQTKPVFFLVGNVSESFVKKLKQFASSFSESKITYNCSEPHQKTGEIYETKENAVQTAIRIGRLCIHKKHPDNIALQVLNTVLGGYLVVG